MVYSEYSPITNPTNQLLNHTIAYTHLPSSSTMVTVASLVTPTVTLGGNLEDGSIVTVKLSLPSYTASSISVIFNVARVALIGKLTVWEVQLKSSPNNINHCNDIHVCIQYSH